MVVRHSVTVTQCVILRPDLRPCGDRPLLAWLMREFVRYGVTEFLLPSSSLASREVITGIQAKLPLPVCLTWIAELEEAGVLSAAWARVNGRILVCDGISLPGDNLADLLVTAASDEAGGTFDHDGVCLFDTTVVGHSEALAHLKLLSRDLMAGDRMLDHRAGTRLWLRPGDISGGLHRRALFLDRDGVLNVDHGYVGSHERFEWIDGAREAIRYATRAGWHVFVVTNQSGVARGLYAEDDVRDLLGWIADQARAAGGTIDDTRFCPFHPDASVDAYRQAHPWRKPLPGMLLDLIEKWELDPARAVMVGDQDTDMRAAVAAGIRGYLFPGGDLLSFIRPILDAGI